MLDGQRRGSARSKGGGSAASPKEGMWEGEGREEGARRPKVQRQGRFWRTLGQHKGDGPI